MKIIEINPSIKKLVDANGGYCPSIEKQNKGTMCICQEFRDMAIDLLRTIGTIRLRPFGMHLKTNQVSR